MIIFIYQNCVVSFNAVVVAVIVVVTVVVVVFADVVGVILAHDVVLN